MLLAAVSKTCLGPAFGVDTWLTGVDVIGVLLMTFSKTCLGSTLGAGI